MKGMIRTMGISDLLLLYSIPGAQKVNEEPWEKTHYSTLHPNTVRNIPVVLK